MCMSAIYWARIDRVYFGTRLEDTSKIGFDDEFQYIDFRLPWKERKAIQCFPDFEREYALKACEAWRTNRIGIPTKRNPRKNRDQTASSARSASATQPRALLRFSEPMVAGSIPAGCANAQWL